MGALLEIILQTVGGLVIAGILVYFAMKEVEKLGARRNRRRGNVENS